MITRQQLDYLVSYSDQIFALVDRFALDDLILARPLISEQERLHFLVSKGDDLATNICLDIYADLKKLLGINPFDEANISVHSRALLRPEHFVKQYADNSMLSFAIKPSKEQVARFIEAHLSYMLERPSDEQNVLSLARAPTSSLMSASSPRQLHWHMLSALKEDGFFEKRDAIIEKARNCGYEQLWVIVPTFLTSLNLDVCHCLFDSLPERTPSLENRNRFLSLHLIFYFVSKIFF